MLRVARGRTVPWHDSVRILLPRVSHGVLRPDYRRRYGQLTSTEALKNFVYNEPVAVEGFGESAKGFRRLSTDEGALGGKKQKRSAPSSAPNKPISLRLSDRDHKNEIFIDLLERLTVLFAPNGSVVRAEIDGCIQMKSFLQGSPELHIGLNENLQIGRDSGSYGTVLDDCNFHECVKLDDFEGNRELVLRPPDGEFTLMNYRISGNPTQALPFRVSVSSEDTSDHGRVDVVVRLDCDIPPKSYGSNLLIRVAVPKATSSCSYELGAPGQTVEYKKDEKVALWKITKAAGGLSYYCRLKVGHHLPVAALCDSILPRTHISPTTRYTFGAHLFLFYCWDR